MEDLKYKNKYLKYKKKYFDLKEKSKKFNSKAGGPVNQDYFTVYDRNGDNYTLFMFDKKNESRFSIQVRNIVGKNLGQFNQDNYTYRSGEESVDDILRYDFACFLTYKRYELRYTDPEIIGFILASEKPKSGRIPKHIYIDFVELRKHTDDINPFGIGLGLCKPMLTKFIFWLNTYKKFEKFKIWNASEYGIQARKCYTDFHYPMDNGSIHFNYKYLITDNINGWYDLHNARNLRQGEKANEYVFIDVQVNMYVERKYALDFEDYGSLYTIQQFKDFYGADEFQFIWDNAVPEHRYSTISGYKDKLYSFDDFRVAWGEEAEYQWSIAKQVMPYYKRSGYTFLQYMQDFGQMGGIECWNNNNRNCRGEDMKFSLVYSKFATTYTLLHFKFYWGKKYWKEKWDAALPEYRYSTIQGYEDKLYSFDDFKLEWGENAEYQWSQARRVDPYEQLRGFTFLQYMQEFGQKNGINCWNNYGKDCSKGLPQLELRYIDNSLYSYNDMWGEGKQHLWDDAEPNERILHNTLQ